ncbi:MAG: sigma-70 family RNA polymerase sigma factor [Pseudomonadota bacterium]
MTVLAYRRPAKILPESKPMKGTDSGSNVALTPEEDARAKEQRAATALVARIRKGDLAAEQEMVKRYSSPLLFMLKRRCGDPELANDLHQDVFRVVIERLRDRGIAEPALLAGFIQSTGRNLLIGVIRRRQRRQTYADSDAIAEARDDGQATQADETEAAQMAIYVRDLLEELGSDRDRAILTRFYLNQEDKASICDGLELSDLHFNRVLYRAKKRFRELLQASDSGLVKELIAGRDS